MKRIHFYKARLTPALKKCRTHFFLAFLLLLLLLVTACGGTTSTSSASTTATAGATATSATNTRKTALAQSLETLDPYLPTFKKLLAQGLHLTATQLTQKMQAGQTLTSLANAQGLSATQLSTLIASALSTTLAPLVQSGQMTQQQINKLTLRLQKKPDLLDTVLAQ